MIKTIATSAVTALIVCVVMLMSGLVGGNSQPAVGGETRFPNSDLTAQSITSTSFVRAQGEAHRFGSASQRNVMYFGAVDGCAAVFFNSSTTQTVQATSTAFCNL